MSLRFAFNLALMLVLYASYGQAQNRLISNAALAEKVYLQTDGTVYTTDQTIWYKAIVLSAASHLPTSLSGVLYIELIGEDEQIRQQKILKLEAGIGNGFFQLDETFPPGRYLIRAYTHWNKNFGTDFFYSQYIDIYSDKAYKVINAIPDISVMDRNGALTLRAELAPQLIDSLHTGVLSVFLKTGGLQDSLLIKPSDSGQYLLNYELPSNTDLATISLRSDNGKAFVRTVQVNNDAIDLQFFPESGQLVHGLTSKVAFKAVAPSGDGVLVKGEIVDADGQLITNFESNHLGMGSFVLFSSSTQRYFARVQSRTDPDLWLKYPLPDVGNKGTVFSVRESNERILLRITTTSHQGDSVFVSSTSRGVRYLQAKGKLSAEGALRFVLPSAEYPEGIIVFNLKDRTGRTLAERLYFNHTKKDRLGINISSDLPNYEQRVKTNLAVEITNQKGEPVKASLSYLVINKQEMSKLQQQRNNILSYLLMSSELKGTVEEPGYYFRSDTTMAKDLDLLMLTQGWRQYKYRVDMPPPVHQPEYKLTLSGAVSAPLSSRKKKEGVDLTLMTFGKSTPDIYKATTDSTGRFYFDLKDAFGQRMNVTIQTANARGKNKNYQVALDKNESPELIFDHKPEIAAPDTLIKVLVEKHRERKLIEDAYRSASDVRDLGEFIVEDYAMTPEREKVVEVHGMPDVVIEREAIESEEKKWSYGLYSVIKRSFPGDVNFMTMRKDGSRIGYDSVYVIGSEITMVMVDGIPVQLDDYALVAGFPVSEVKSFEIIKNPRDFGKLYYEVFPVSGTLPFYPAIIAIYTQSGKGIFSAKKADGMFLGSIEVFSPVREFYEPKYEKLTRADWVKPDYRALIHWQPQVSTDATGQATVSFYNADRIGEMLVVVEAIAEDGSIGYREFVYEVVKNTDRD